MDSGCSKNMTRKIEEFLSLKVIEGRCVSFESGKKSCILGVRKIRRSLNHATENVYYVSRIKYGLLVHLKFVTK